MKKSGINLLTPAPRTTCSKKCRFLFQKRNRHNMHLFLQSEILTDIPTKILTFVMNLGNTFHRTSQSLVLGFTIRGN